MGIYLGNNQVSPSGIDKAYLGSNLIYESIPKIKIIITHEGSTIGGIRNRNSYLYINGNNYYEVGEYEFPLGTTVNVIAKSAQTGGGNMSYINIFEDGKYKANTYDNYGFTTVYTFSLTNEMYIKLAKGNVETSVTTPDVSIKQKVFKDLYASFTFDNPNNRYSDNSGNGNNLSYEGERYFSFNDCSLNGFTKEFYHSNYYAGDYLYKNNSLYDINTGNSLCCWIKPKNNQNEYMNAIFTSYDGNINAGLDIGVTYNNLVIRSVNNGISNGIVSTSSILNNYHFACLTYDGNNILKGYLDGVLIGTNNIGKITQYPSIFRILMQYSGTSVRNYVGALTGIRVFHTELTQEDITTLYNNGQGI